MKRALLLTVVVAASLGASLLIPDVRRAAHPVFVRLKGRLTVEERVEKVGPEARARLSPYFSEARIDYPPFRACIVCLKRERRVLLFAANEGGDMQLVVSYPITAASGGPGPKLRRGDRQVPEGRYAIDSLNPNSRFHLSMRLDYPNAFDRWAGTQDGRKDLGDDIFLHGGRDSVGCVAIGDIAIEELFVVAADAGLRNVEVVIAPQDLRSGDVPPASDTDPGWLADLYAGLETRMASLPTRGGH
jgi:hypothetical protein